MESGAFIPTKGKLKYPIEYNKKIPYFDDFMRRYSRSAYYNQRNRLIEFALYLETFFNKKITEATYEEILHFFKNDINERNIIREAKQKWRDVINSYYKYYGEIYEKTKGKPFINPVPSKNLFDFSEKPMTIDDLEKEEELLDYETVEKILNYMYFTRRRLFIITSILLYTGARISETCSIELTNIDLEERFFFTKIKSRIYENKYGIYFLPKFFIPFLSEWIETIKIEYPNTRYLFPSPFPSQSYGHISTNTIRENLRKVKNELGLKCRMNPHAFRDFVNTARFDKGLKTEYRCLLLNQTPKNVNVQYYLKKYKKRKELQKIYDQTLPFPPFKPKLNLF